MPTAAKRKRIGKFARIGEDITPPPALASQPGHPIRIRTERAATVARWFGLSRHEPSNADARRDETLPPIALPTAGTILLLTGPSGSGKSRLLATLHQQAGDDIDLIDLAALTPPAQTPLVDCFGDAPLRDILLLLARIGLGEAWTYLRTPEELSEGQRFRLKLALGLHAAKRQAPGRQSTARRVILVCDEFAAVLDRITAMVVARCLRRSIDANPHLAAIVATAHDDLQPALKPDLIAWCDFGRVEWHPTRRER
jgi:ABC-type thiamine transport system ATPase subunit